MRQESENTTPSLVVVRFEPQLTSDRFILFRQHFIRVGLARVPSSRSRAAETHHTPASARLFFFVCFYSVRQGPLKTCFGPFWCKVLSSVFIAVAYMHTHPPRLSTPAKQVCLAPCCWLINSVHRRFCPRQESSVFAKPRQPSLTPRDPPPPLYTRIMYTW